MFYLTADNYGEWIIEVVAEIDGVEVSAAAVLDFYSRSSVEEGENTEAYHTPQFGYEFASTWVGDGVPFRSFFNYDLDGDGETEKYALGLTFYDEEQYGVPLMRMQYLIFDGDWLAQKIVPGVWKCEDNGRLVFVPEFANILENTQIRFWRGSMDDVPLPDVSLTDDGPWSAMASIYATNEHTDNWIFEAVTEIDGEPIVAASVILCDVARDQ